MGLAVYWEAVRGARLYFALSSTGQNCTSMGDPFCIISPIGCSENHTLTVMAENQAGPSSPSHPQDLLTCMHYTQIYWLCKHTNIHLYRFNTNWLKFLYTLNIISQIHIHVCVNTPVHWAVRLKYGLETFCLLTCLSIIEICFWICLGLTKYGLCLN